MRVLRSSLYDSPAEPPMTTVVRDSDTRDTLESHRVDLLHKFTEHWAIYDIFDMADGGIEDATLEAIKRQAANAEQEGHQAMLYYWTVMTWERVTPGGTIFMDKPAPLSREEVVEVFEHLARRPDYENYHVVTHARDGEPVTLTNGQIGDAR